MAKGRIEFDIEQCKGCQLCTSACPVNIIRMSDNVNRKGYNVPYVTNPELCTGCANCAVMCPDSVISVYRIIKV